MARERIVAADKSFDPYQGIASAMPNKLQNSITPSGAGSAPGCHAVTSA
jgi:hypothetical protein